MTELRRTLTRGDLVFAVIGGVVGSGIFLIPAETLRATGGATSTALLVWVLGGVLCLLGALTYAELGASAPEAGGVYSYIRDAFGPLPAFLYGWVLFLVIGPATVAALAVASVGYLREIVPLGDGGARVAALVMIVVIAAVQRRLTTPICLDESITRLGRAEDMLAVGSGRIINIKPGRVGGLAASLAIHDLCSRSGVPMWCGGMLESKIGRAYNVALASLPNLTLPGDLSPSRRYRERDLVTPEWSMDPDGTVRGPLDRAGLGVTPDRDRTDALTGRRATLASPRAAAGVS